eukprot:405867-Rhodomonas_salina.1
MPGTDLPYMELSAYAPDIRCPEYETSTFVSLSSYARAMCSPVLSQCGTVTGTDNAYAAICLCACYAMRTTDSTQLLCSPAYFHSVRYVCQAYLPTHSLHHAQYHDRKHRTVVLGTSYAMPGTDLRYAATKQAMVLCPCCLKGSLGKAVKHAAKVGPRPETLDPRP